MIDEKPVVENTMEHVFQVDLRGLIELLSGHLYSGPAVFVRELLQNAVDAIEARRRIEPRHVGDIKFELLESAAGPSTLIVQDNGIGLTEEEIHTFLATIGYSSKRGELVERPQDFLGQFGIGLLSCFMVTDEIAVITNSAREGSRPVEWRGRSNGTYTVRVLDQPVQPGTQVFLRAKEDAADFFAAEAVLQLMRNYGEFLEPPISFVHNGQTTPINQTPPWKEKEDNGAGRTAILQFGQSAFGVDALDIVPLRTIHGDISGWAYVLSEPVFAGARQTQRVYLKNMLLSAGPQELLPEWAFFVQCVVNVRSLRPTASREAFYDDVDFELARDELGQCLRQYLMKLGRDEPERLQRLIAVHHLAVKSLAAEDDECLRLFADWLPFETSLGSMTLGQFRRENPVIRFVRTRDQFRQIAQVAASQSIAVINAGYVYDVEILERIGSILEDVEVKPFEVDELANQFEELTIAERGQTQEFERLADLTLQRFKCGAELRKFRPVELPALFVTNREVDFLRLVEQSQEVADSLWSDVLGRIADRGAPAMALLHLNFANPLVRRISTVNDPHLQSNCIEMLYVQALLLGHVPLKRNEVALLNDGLLKLINRAIDGSES